MRIMKDGILKLLNFIRNQNDFLKVGGVLSLSYFVVSFLL